MSDDKKKDETTPKEPKRGQGSHTRLGFAPPNDPVYSGGLIVSGRKVILPEPEKTPKKKEE